MKNTSLKLVLLTVVLTVAGASQSWAYDHDKTGWYDEHHNHHDFVVHNHHHGYWDKDNSGARIFINID